MVSLMVRMFLIFALWLVSLSATFAEGETHAKIQTSMGDIIVELNADAAPLTVANFFEYATSGHYDRTLIHRVVHGFVIQGGGYSRFFTERPTRDPIPYEADNGLKNVRGAIAMARSDSPDSAAAQWFINLKDNPKLDHKMFEGLPVHGYTVFGRVVEGMEVADAIGAVPTGPGGQFDAEVPIDPVIIERVDPVVWPEAE